MDKSNRTFLIVAGLVAFLVARLLEDSLVLYWLIFAVGMAASIGGCYIWTKLKNRHWGFMFWGLLTPVGLLGISLLRDKSSSVEVKRNG